MGRNRERHVHTPPMAESVRTLLEKVIAAFPGVSGEVPGARRAAGDSLEAELAGLGPIRSVRFLGFVKHGVAIDGSDSSDAGSLFPPEATHWEAYDIEQKRGSSVWLVAATVEGTLQRIEVAIR